MPNCAATSDSEPPPAARERRPIRHSQLIPFSKIAEVFDNPDSDDPKDRWDTDRVTRRFKALDPPLGFQFKRGGPWYVTFEEFERRLKPLADLYVKRLHENDIYHL